MMISARRQKQLAYWGLRVIARAPFFRFKWWRRLVRIVELQIVKRLGSWIVDDRFYVACNPDIRSSAIGSLKHYCYFGFEEGRFPNVAFDTGYYRAKFMVSAERYMNPVVHFLLVGRDKKQSPSPWFDFDFYVRVNPDVAIAGINPIVHFVKYGIEANRRSCPMFDPNSYLASHPDVLASGVPALEHFVRYGEAEGRTGSAWAAAPSAPRRMIEQSIDPHNLENKILNLPVRRRSRILVDVIMPIYRGHTETLSAIYHVLKAENSTAYSLICIDDCSPEEELSRSLDRLHAAKKIRLIRNKHNLGFVRSVNKGMQLSKSRDVILLNSDTEVYNDWIDRLRQCAYLSKAHGTVTPLTNSGTICSYPKFMRDNDLPLEVSYDELDRIASLVNRGAALPAPTAVGFCMYIKRATIDDVGFFDDEAFGTGYGEENDFCQRAQAAGWLDIIDPAVFVRHLGSMSFQGQRGERVANALRVLRRRYPKYDSDVQRFIHADQLRPFRARLDRERLVRMKGERNVLLVSHMRGGGTELHVQQEVERLVAAGWSVFRMGADQGSTRRVIHWHSSVPDVPNLDSLDLEQDRTQIIELWRSLNLSEVHVHHIADFGPEGAKKIAGLLTEANIRWRYTIHDYLVICPRINLVDENGQYCHEPDEQGCQRCLLGRRSQFAVTDISKWRHQQLSLLEGAYEVVVPDDDVKFRLNRYWPSLDITTTPHEDEGSIPAPVVLPKGKERLRIGTIGAISAINGFNMLLRCAADSASRSLPIELVVVGFTEDDTRARANGIEITGAYKNENVQQIIRDEEVDLIFLASTWPETYSYTLSIALASGLPVAAFDIGAVANRLKKTSADHLLMPIDISESKINDHLLRFWNQLRQKRNNDV